MGKPSPNSHHHQYVDPEKQSGMEYGYPEHHHYNYPEPAPGYPVSNNYYPPGEAHAYPNKPGQYPQPPYYNYDQQEYPLIDDDPSSKNTSFTRVMLVLMILLISCLCMMTVVMWFLYGTYIPEFEISSINLSNFTTASDGAHLSPGTTWDAAVLIRNPNHDIDIDFDNVRSVVMYRGNILGFSGMQGFDIPRKGEFKLGLSVPAGADNQMNVDNGLIVQALAHDWSDGVAVFSLRLAMRANFSSPERGYREESLTVSCEDLSVESSSATEGVGRLNDIGGNPCLISLY